MFGVSPSPFLLNATIDLHLEQYLSTALDFLSKLCKSFYVDDLISGSDDKEKAYHFCVNSKEVMKAGGFHLRKLNSNCSTQNNNQDNGQEEPTKSSVNQSRRVLEHRRYMVCCRMSLPIAFLSLSVSLLM